MTSSHQWWRAGSNRSPLQSGWQTRSIDSCARSRRDISHRAREWSGLRLEFVMLTRCRREHVCRGAMQNGSRMQKTLTARSWITPCDPSHGRYALEHANTLNGGQRGFEARNIARIMANSADRFRKISVIARSRSPHTWRRFGRPDAVLIPRPQASPGQPRPGVSLDATRRARTRPQIRSGFRGAALAFNCGHALPSTRKHPSFQDSTFALARRAAP
jgi:hypothetical protein